LSNYSDTKLVPIGEILKPHGIKGEVKILLFNIDSKSLKNGSMAFLKDSKSNYHEYKVEAIMYSRKKNRVKFFEINSIDEADKLRSFIVNMRREDLPQLNESEYYLNDLIDYNIIDKIDNNYGTVRDILNFPANDVLSVCFNGKEFFIPIIDDVILKINHKSKKIIIDPISGLFD